MNTPNRVARWLCSALAALDGVVLLYLASRYDWTFDLPQVGPTPAGWIVQLILLAVLIAAELLAAAFVALVAAAIVMEVRGGWRPTRRLAILASCVLGAVLTIIVVEAVVSLRPALGGLAAVFIDRVVAFDRLTSGHSSGAHSASMGAYLVMLCGAAYLAEKYLLRWWRLRWPVSIAAIAIVTWPVWTVLEGERAQREWIAAQQWHALAEHQPWSEALTACSAKGPGWRLPRPRELSFYLSTRPDAILRSRGTAWTLTTAENARWAIVVDLAPSRSGWWRSNSQPWRDRSACERNATRNPIADDDWFTALHARVCASTDRSPALYPSSMQLLATIRGRILGPTPKLLTSQTQAATICVKPAQPESPLPPWGRRYPQEQEFTTAAEFLAAMRDICRAGSTHGDAAACAAFAPEAAGEDDVSNITRPTP